MTKTFIYVLKDPLTQEVRYVGKANKPNRRYYSHLRKDKTASSHKINWVQNLLKNNLKPILEIVEEVGLDEWKEKERYYIEYFKKEGNDIINHTLGGDGLTMGNQTSFKKGMVSHNKGKGGVWNICKICGNGFKTSPSGSKKYKCCSTKCSNAYRSKYPNKGAFKKGSTPFDRSIPVLQLEKNTLSVIADYKSQKEAQDFTGASKISQVLKGKLKTSGGFKWKRKEF